MTTLTEDAAKLEGRKRGKAKARGNGRGTVFKLPDGRYRWQYRNRSEERRVGKEC